MKFEKILRNTLALSVAVAGVVSLASCQIFGDGSKPDDGDNSTHTHEIKFVSGMDATCTADGFEDYYECEGCGKLFADENGETEIASPEVIEKVDHTEVVIPAKPSTCTEDGATEGKKCGTCGRILLAPNKIAHKGFLLNGEHICNATLNDHGIAGLTVIFENDEYTISGENAVIESINLDDLTLNVLGGITITPTEAIEAIVAHNATINFIGGETLVNGTIATNESFVNIDNGAIVTVDGGHVYTKGELVLDDSQEFGYKHRLFVRNGTLNINHDNDGAAVLWSNSIQVGSEKENLKGYININSGADSGMRIEDDFATRWMFANGELNFVADEGSAAAAIKLGGNKGKNIDFLNGMKVSVKNYKIAFFAEWLYVYAAFSSDTFSIENVEVAMTANKRLRIYSQEIVQVEYTDAEGKTGLANVRLSGNLIVGNVYAGESYADFTFIDFPTAEDYGSWPVADDVKVEFISWVE